MRARPRTGGIFGFLTHNQTLKAFEELVWKGEYELGIIPKGNHDFHKFLRPEDLTERLAARGLRTADLKGVAFDFDTPSATLVDDLDVSYLGYAVKD